MTRNRPTLLARALASVYDQTHRPLEVVLIDNQSNTPVKAPPPPPGVSISHAKAPTKLNASAARNFGARHAKGAFIGFLDDDDFFLPSKIESQLAAFEREPSADFCIIDTELRRSDGATVMRLDDPQDIESLLLYRPIHTNSPLIRADVLRREWFNEALDKYTDLHLTFRLFQNYRCVRAEGVGAVWS